MRRLLKAGLALLAVLNLAACQKKEPEPEVLMITNKAEIMSVKADMSGYKWLYDDDPAFSETTMREAIKMFTEKGSGILYMGYVGCPWCERAVPVLNAAAKEQNLNILYVNVHDTQINSMEDYYALEPYIKEIFDTDKNGEAVFKVPEVIAIKDGVIVGHHLALVEGYKIEDAESQMNNEQKEELKQIYLDLFRAAAD